MSVQAPVDPGTEFLGYRIEELVGRGGMGLVYRALDLRLKRHVALKFITPELASDERFRSRFLRESELAASLDHPNVVPIYDAGETHDRLYLTMRYVEGTDLGTLLRAEGPLVPARALAISRQVGRALDAAHAGGLVHRDVKPSNVLLDVTEHVYLADFGLTRRHAEDGAFPGDGQSLGTLAYLAPEQIEGAGADGRADVYALGCLLFECLTGQKPFEEASSLAIAWAHLEEEPPAASGRNSSLPHSLDAVLLKALAKDPADRYGTCEALVDAAEEALGLRRGPVVTPRRAALALAAAVAAVVALVAVAVLVTRGEDAPFAARPNTLVQIDTEKEAVTGTVAVGRRPMATAAYGKTAWAYNEDDGTVSEVDGREGVELHATRIRATPLDLGVFAGPVLAADGHGAWLLGADANGAAVLTRVHPGGRGRRELPLFGEPRGVAVGENAVWVIVQTAKAGRELGQVLRIDPERWELTARLPLIETAASASARFFSSDVQGLVEDRMPLFGPGVSADGIAVGHGAVWVVSSPESLLYRLDPRSLRWTTGVWVGENAAARPVVEPDGVSVGVAGTGGIIVTPNATRLVSTWNGAGPEDGLYVGFDGYTWSYDKPTGSLLRWDGRLSPSRTIRLAATPPAFDGPCLTSITSWAKTVWVSVAGSIAGACP
jgi:tRNA A-37 threonylcarbamoyl transferase component Bud32